MATRTADQLDYDVILSHIGDLGSFQVRIGLFLSLISAVGGLAVGLNELTNCMPVIGQ